ncbi:hypothetical protein BH10PLA2_BH10PLA2_03300 [soil metagenome]
MKESNYLLRTLGRNEVGQPFQADNWNRHPERALTPVRLESPTEQGRPSHQRRSGFSGS